MNTADRNIGKPLQVGSTEGNLRSAAQINKRGDVTDNKNVLSSTSVNQGPTARTSQPTHVARTTNSAVGKASIEKPLKHVDLDQIGLKGVSALKESTGGDTAIQKLLVFLGLDDLELTNSFNSNTKAATVDKESLSDRFFTKIEVLINISDDESVVDQMLERVGIYNKDVSSKDK